VLLGQVSEITVISSNPNASVGGGASQVSFVTPSGTNRWHGTLYWYNKNGALAANDWFSNRDGLARPQLNQNQAGGALGGPIWTDKLFFYANYEALRVKDRQTVIHSIPTADARRGVFTYNDAAGTLRKVNVLEAAGVSVDPFMQSILEQIPGPDKINLPEAGDSRDGVLRNSGGYAFNVRSNRNLDNLSARLDSVLSDRTTLFGTLVRSRYALDLPDFALDYAKIPKVRNDDARTLVSATWQWSPRPRFTHELQGGFNLAPTTFRTSQQFGEFIIEPAMFTSPVNPFRTQGRRSNTFTLGNNASLWQGRNHFQFGFRTQQVRASSFNESGITPTYGLGIGTGNPGLNEGQLPGISGNDLPVANALLATLAGYVTRYTQTFNVADQASGFVSGAPLQRHFRLDDYAGYLQHRWRMRPGLTLTLGARYEYLPPVGERDSLALLPVVNIGNVLATLLSNATLDFAGSSAGRPWHRADRNNLAPNAGLAWDVFGDGTTALRAAYSVHFVNDETIRTVDYSAATNAGLKAVSEQHGLSGLISKSLPSVTQPVYNIPRRFEDNYLLNRSSTFSMPDPNLRTPYLQQWNLSLQREIKGWFVEARYVGNHGTKLYRTLDLNQVVIRENGFPDDLLRAQRNGELARTATGLFDPSFNPGLAGSQPLQVFPRLADGGLLHQPVIRRLVETGEAGELARMYQVNGLNGSVSFFRNPFGLESSMVSNASNSSYHALQLELLRRAFKGLTVQANYSFSKVLTDAIGTQQHRFDPYLDNANPSIERARAHYDVTHALKANFVYELPFGHMHSAPSRWRPWLEGWSVSGILVRQSGLPFSVVSNRGTVNHRGVYSRANHANTHLAKEELESVFRFRQTERGPYFVDSSILGPDGRAVSLEGGPPFPGQVFFHPRAGQLGSLQQRLLTGPMTFNMDAAIMKRTRMGERQFLELRIEAFNVFNHPSWAVDSQSIDSQDFGRISRTRYAPRRIQISLHYEF
jgi:hypothetical protein